MFGAFLHQRPARQAIPFGEGPRSDPPMFLKILDMVGPAERVEHSVEQRQSDSVTSGSGRTSGRQMVLLII